MRNYEILTTIAGQPFAAKASALLEDAGIPIMVEHVDLGDDMLPLHGFRVLVPREFSGSAHRLITAAAALPHELN